MTEHQARIASLFDQLVDDYDNVGVDFFQPIAHGLVRALAPEPGEHAVDIGCGRGAVALALASEVGPQGSVIGLDLSPRMIEAATDAATRSGRRVDFAVGDAMAPGLESGSLDIVASSLVLFFLPDPAAALRAWRDLLRDGGRVGVSTFGPYSDEWRTTVDSVLHANAGPGVADARTTGASGPFGSDEGMESLLADAGFRDVRTELTTVSPRFDDAEHWYRWSMSVGQRQFWQSIPDTDRERVRAEVFAAVDRCRDDAGRIGFDQQIRYTVGRR